MYMYMFIYIYIYIHFLSQVYTTNLDLYYWDEIMGQLT